MIKMTSIVSILLDVFNHEADQALFVLKVASETDLGFKPREDMRNLGALANHLAQIPSLDPSMYMREIDSPEKAQEWEKQLKRETIDEMVKVFQKGIEDVNGMFKSMTDTDFLEKKLKPFYSDGESKAWDYYFPEMIAHIAMHKMQLWMYLKLAGEDVNMMTYYGIPT